MGPRHPHPHAHPLQVLWADLEAVVATHPFAQLHADTDIGALSEGWEENFLRGPGTWIEPTSPGPLSWPPFHQAYPPALGPTRWLAGHIMGADDPSMGW